ncbi:MAG: AAA family ATPase [Clostridia bacterium]|nr:AAA family ATPase [Clostridia bacterium]
MKKITVSFDGKWVLSNKGSDQLPVEKFIKYAEEYLKAEVLYSSFTVCELLIRDCEVNENELFDCVNEIIDEAFGMDFDRKVFNCEVTDYNPEEKVEEKAESSAKSENEAAKKSGTVADKIKALIGVEEFKNLADEIVRIAPSLKKHNTEKALISRDYLFAINNGDGASTYARLFTELLIENELLPGSNKKILRETKLLSEEMAKEIGKSPFAFVYDALEEITNKNTSGVIIIDMCEWMSKVYDVKFRDFLYTLDNYTEKAVYIFRIPFVDKEVVDDISSALNDVLQVQSLSFIPFDYSELKAYASSLIEKFGFSMSDEAWEVFEARVNAEKNDGRFYGLNTVEKIVNDIIYHKQLNDSAKGIDSVDVNKNDIVEIAPTLNMEEIAGIDFLDTMVGMQPIKERIEEIIGQIEISRCLKELGSPCIHMRFVGNPGTGKTTVARIIGKILKEKGVLRNGSFFEYMGRDLCGKYVGHTAPQTAAICRDAYGSVLFIDEAYSLYSDDMGGKDFGREAIEALIAEMENHRSDLVVIMAGYPKEMKELMGANPGLESRMPYVIEFPNYTKNQLFEIYMRMVNKSFTYKEGFEETAKAYFENLPDEVINAKDFSNARFVRNIFERTYGKAFRRAQLNKEEPTVLIKEDFNLAVCDQEFKKLMSKPKKSSLGFI